MQISALNDKIKRLKKQPKAAAVQMILNQTNNLYLPPLGEVVKNPMS
jgi:hypothetical protein